MTVATLDRTVLSQPKDAKLVALVTRVSTQRQADNDEGSLKTQLQRIRKHIEYKAATSGEDWLETGVYELRAVSGKDSMRSEEYAELFAAIRAGRVNTILCTALERLCRSVKDFLWFFEFINEHGVEFVCLKQQYDTTTPQGKLFVTIMMALAEFEREQTADRTRDAMRARSERGLWNGGQLLGYDLDVEHKGHLIPNEDEAAVVNFAFETYLSCGSLREVVPALNARGYRTKAYESRRGRLHAGKPFALSSVRYLLMNPAYVGKKEVSKTSRADRNPQVGPYGLVDAVWPAIVDQDKFGEVQRLLSRNGKVRHNSAAPVRHTYVLGRGVLHCGRCGIGMEGRSGTGRLGATYFYYVCRNKECGLRVSADEIEATVLGRIGELARTPLLLDRLVAETNGLLLRRGPTLDRQKKTLHKSLDSVKAEAEKIMRDWSGISGSDAHAFLTERLNDLGRRRSELEVSLREVEDASASLDERVVSADEVRTALSRFDEVYACLKPHEQRELVHLLIRKAELYDRKIVLEIGGSIPAILAGTPDRSDPRFGRLAWLPDEDSNLEPSG